MQRSCEICKTPLVGRQRRYCSRPCVAQGTKSWTYRTATLRDCDICGDKHRRKSKYCSGECAEVGMKAQGYRADFELLLVEDSNARADTIKQWLLRTGVKQRKCEECGITSWMGKAAPIALDHVNGNRRDNRLENLRILCPNCHAQTDTFCGKNKKRKGS